MEQPVTAPVAAQEPSYITIEDLVKVELTVGMIEQCEIVPQSDKAS